MSRRQLFTGYRIQVGKDSKYKHSLGGSHEIEAAVCLNCEKPLMLNARIDTKDPRIRLDGFPAETVPLLCCGRCSLSWHPFTYTVINDSAIKIDQFHAGETTWDDWNESVGMDVFPVQPFDLQPIPDRVQVLYDRLNDDEEISDEEEAEIASFTNQYALPEVGGYPCIDVINQIGGRAFLCQGVEDPPCPTCKSRGKDRKMFFFATLTNEPEKDFVVGYEGIQIIFFFCPECNSIQVVHSMD